MIAFFLGRQPEISLAEIQAVFKKTPQLLTGQVALMDVDPAIAAAQAPHLGSIIKVAEIIDQDFVINYDNLTQLAEQLWGKVDGKVTLGLSIYDKSISKRTATTMRLAARNAIKMIGRTVRIVPADGPITPTATVLHNKLAIGNPKKVELSFIKPGGHSRSKDWQVKHQQFAADVIEGRHYVVARTLYIQDIDDYTVRDRERPRRDAQNGMLPPKLAQTMINLALGARQSGQATRLLDPFCGTGVTLQEAALMGMEVYGTDLNQSMIFFTRANLQWLARTKHIDIKMNLQMGDATKFDWQQWAAPHIIDLVVSEAYLGQSFLKTPDTNELLANMHKCNTIIGKALANLGRQLPSGAGVCLGVPAWFIRDHIHHLRLVRNVKRFGFKDMTKGANLIYHRPGQFVGRELLVLQKQ